MNEPNTSSNIANRSVTRILIRIVVIVAVVFLLPKIISGDILGNKSVDAAEKYVSQQVYSSLGIACDHFKSKVIYKEGDVKLITVQFYLPDATSPSGSYCVYCDGGYVVNSTKMLEADYPYRDKLSELKALFGI